MSNKLKIITLSNFRYREVALNWVRHVEKIGIENYEVVCVDKPCHRYLKKRGVKVGEVYPVKKFRRYAFNRKARSWRGVVRRLILPPPLRGLRGAAYKMVYKTLVARELLQAGYDVMTSDSDALWLKNPIEDLFLGNSHDIVVSTDWMDNAFPAQFSDRYGYSLCMGWIAYKSRPEVIHYLDRFLDELEKQKWTSDQLAFNLFLMSKNPDIKKSDLGDVFVADGVEILALNKQLVKRGRFSPQTYVWHPDARKNPVYKKRCFENRGFWLA